MKSILFILGLLLSFALAPSAPNPASADLVFINGNVYTVDEKRPHAEAIAVKGDRIVFAGSNNDAKTFQDTNTRVVDLHGATVVPGMTDAHYHFIGVGQREMNLNLEDITNLEDFLTKVKARVDQAKPGEWVTGRGWIETFWKPPVFPTRWDLDKISPNNPMILGRADGHGAVANSAARAQRAVRNNFDGAQVQATVVGFNDRAFTQQAICFWARPINSFVDAYL